MERITNTTMEDDNKNTNASFAEYDFGHIAHIIKDTKDMLKDVLYSIGLTRTSKKALLRTAKDNMDFVSKVLEDSRESLNGVKFIAYSDPNEVADEEDGCDVVEDEA